MTNNPSNHRQSNKNKVNKGTMSSMTVRPWFVDLVPSLLAALAVSLWLTDTSGDSKSTIEVVILAILVSSIVSVLLPWRANERKFRYFNYLWLAVTGLYTLYVFYILLFWQPNITF